MLNILRNQYAAIQDAHRLAWRHGYAGLKWEFVWCIVELETCIRDYENNIRSHASAQAAIRRSRGLVAVISGMAYREQIAKAS